MNKWNSIYNDVETVSGTTIKIPNIKYTVKKDVVKRGFTEWWNKPIKWWHIPVSILVVVPIYLFIKFIVEVK